MIVQTYIEMDVMLEGVTQTFLFTYPQNDIAFDSIPALQGVSIAPQVVDPGNTMGIRASVRVALRDFQYPLAGTDFNAGTFFGKLRARRGSLQGSALRIIRGEAGQTLADMTTEHFVIESVTRSGESVTIVAKDLLKLADGDRSQAPQISRGRVATAITDIETTLTLTPSGIGEADYPSSGKVNIGGSEVCAFTRVSDVLTLTRAAEPEEHEVDELVQLVLIYDGESPADIIYDLLTTYTDVSPAWCSLSEWQSDINTYVARLYHAEIAEPTSVHELINELISQVGLVMYWDGIAQRIRLSTLRPMVANRTITTDEIIEDTFRADEKPDKRVSEVWTYFGLRDPLDDIGEAKSYRTVLVTLDEAGTDDYVTPAIKKVFSRWIAINNRAAASRLNAMLLARYRDPPRMFSFSLSRFSAEPTLGAVANVAHWALQDEDGNDDTVSVQFTSIEKTEDVYNIKAEEMLFNSTQGGTLDPGDESTVERLIYIDTVVHNVNLRSLHDSFYLAAESGDEVTCIISESGIVGSLSASLPALDVGTWPSGVIVKIQVHGRIQGKGGNGGSNSAAAEAGGTALYTRRVITVENNGKIFGGGGGGAAGLLLLVNGTGGGGAGEVGGTPNGTKDAGGAPTQILGSSYGIGGNPGQPGNPGLGGFGTEVPGAAAGLAVDGDSFVTFSPLGTIAGARVN